MSNYHCARLSSERLNLCGQPRCKELSKGSIGRTDKISDIKISDPSATSEPFTLSFVSMPHFAQFLSGVAKFRFPLADLDLPSAVEKGLMDRSGGWHRVESEPVRLGPFGKRIQNYLETPFRFLPPLAEIGYLRMLRRHLPGDVQMEWDFSDRPAGFSP